MFRQMAATLIMLSALPVFACPELAGNYTCANEDGTSESLVISQSTVNGVMQYMINGSELWIDNQAHSIDGDNSFRGASMRAWCENDSVKYEVAGQYYQGDDSVGDLDVVTEMKINGNQFLQTDTGRMKNNQTEVPISSELTCVRDKGN